MTDALKGIKLETVRLSNGFDLFVHPKVMQQFRLSPGQLVGADTMKRVLMANARALGENRMIGRAAQDKKCHCGTI